MSGRHVKGSWNKWEGPARSVGGSPFMPRKPLDMTGTANAWAWGAKEERSVTPAPLPRGERPRRAAGGIQEDNWLFEPLSESDQRALDQAEDEWLNRAF